MAGSSSLTRSFSTATLVDSVGQYSTSEVAELVGLKATQVRHYVRRDLLTPQRGRRGEFRFSFQDVVMLRSAKELLDADVPVRRANRVLLDLKARNAEASRPLSSMRVQAEGTRVVVQEGNNAWDAESGQGSLPFLFDAPDAATDAPAANKIAAFSILGPDQGADTGADPLLIAQRDLRPGASGSDSAESLEGTAGSDTRDLGGFDDFANHIEAESRRSGLSDEMHKKDLLRRDAALKLLETLRLSGLTAPDALANEAGSEAGSVEAGGAKELGAHQVKGVDGVVPQSEQESEQESEKKEREVSVPEADERMLAAGQLSSDDWYNLALDLEEADPDKAPPAYRQALALNPQNTDAQVNLGRLCQLQGNLKQARRHYKLALGHAPEHQLANYNMGTIYDELDEFETARDYYVRAKDIPDAHYNLARLFEVKGDELAALRHMKEYRRLLEADISGR